MGLVVTSPILRCLSVEVPLLSMEHRSRKPMPVINVQNFGDSTLSLMNVPSIMKGFGTSFAAIQAAFQAFAINLKKEAGKKGFIPSRLMDDLQASDSKVLNDLVEGLFMKKLSRPAHKRLVMWPAIPDALTMPTFKAVAAPILFGNIGAFDVTMHEKKFMGSVRFSFTGRRIMCAAPWSEVLGVYKDVPLPPAAPEGEAAPAVQQQTSKMVRDWFRNLTEDLSYNCFKAQRVVSELCFVWSMFVNAVEESIEEGLAENLYYGIVAENEAFVCPPGWVCAEVTGNSNLVGLRLSYISAVCMPEFKAASAAHKASGIKSPAEDDVDTIIDKLEEYFATLTPWSPPVPDAGGQNVVEVGENAAVEAADKAPNIGAAAVEATEKAPGDRLFPIEVVENKETPKVGERWVVFRSIEEMACIAKGCRVFVRADVIFIDNDTILQADVCEILEVHEDDGTIKVKYVFKEGEADGVAVRLCLGTIT